MFNPLALEEDSIGYLKEHFKVNFSEKDSHMALEWAKEFNNFTFDCWKTGRYLSSRFFQSVVDNMCLCSFRESAKKFLDDDTWRYQLIPISAFDGLDGTIEVELPTSEWDGEIRKNIANWAFPGHQVSEVPSDLVKFVRFMYRFMVRPTSYLTPSGWIEISFNVDFDAVDIEDRNILDLIALFVDERIKYERLAYLQLTSKF